MTELGDWDGKVVVVVGDDAVAVGTAVARLRASGRRACGFVGEAGDEAIAEMAAELFPGAEVVMAAPSA